MRIDINACAIAEIRKKCVDVPEAFRDERVAAFVDDVEMLAGVGVKERQATLVDGRGALQRQHQGGDCAQEHCFEDAATTAFIDA